jgi:beta-glucanase (GH16 family)
MGPLAGYRGRAQRSIAIGVVAVAALGMSAAAAAAAGKPASNQAHAAAKTATSILHTTVPAKGKYLLIVWVRSRGKHSRLVAVYLPGQKERSVVANPWWGAAVYYTLNLSATKLEVRTVNAPPAVAVRATLTLRKAAAPSAPPPAATSGGAPAASSTTTSSGGSTTTTTPVSTTPPPNTLDTSAYTKNIFTDDFLTDYTGQPNQLPSSQNWGLDSWGGCGGNTLSQSNTNVGTGANVDGINPDQNAYLTSNGLAITAVRTASGNYVSAQLDSAGHVSSQYGEVEASIEMPAAQGLCPGFWMLGDQNIAGSSSPGEIDVVEAPTFGAGGGLGDPAYFDLHGANTTQVYTLGTNAVNLSSGFHTYAVIWTPTSIGWTIDGVEYASANQASLTIGASWANDFDTSNFHLILDLAVGGWPCDFGPCSPQSPGAPSYTMYVQWVKWLQIP